MSLMSWYNTINWNAQKKLFRFSNAEDYKKWTIGKSKNENLI